MNRRRSSWGAAFRYAAQGIVYTIRNERNMKFHLLSAVLVAAAGIWLRIGRTDWLWLGAAAAGVLTAELINTAIERTVDLAVQEDHPLAKAAKDAAGGAVLVSAAFAAVCGLAILGPPLWRTMFG